VAEFLPLTVPEIRRLLWHLVWRSHPTSPPPSLGHDGDDVTSNAHGDVTGGGEYRMKRGCSTRAFSR